MDDGIGGLFGINQAIFNQYSLATRIQDNDINNFFTGINIARSGTLPSMETNIWRNTIDNCNFSLVSGGNNWYTNWWCNDLYNYNSGSAWTLFDIAPVGGPNNARIQPHGSCGNYPAANTFNLILPSTVLDINNQTSTSVNFTYNYNSASSSIYNPDYEFGPVVVNGCAIPLSEPTFCNIPDPFRMIADILAQRDTTSDSKLISILNSEIYSYYLQMNEIDSAISFIDTMQIEGIDELLLDLYFIKENKDSITSIINRMPISSTEDINYVSYLNILVDLMEDSLTIADLDSAQLNTIAGLSLGTDNVAYHARSILNTIYGTPVNFECDKVNACGESRISSSISPNLPKYLDILENYPNPCAISTIFRIPEVARNNPDLQLTIIDQTGKVVVEEPTINSELLEFNCEFLPNGVYLYCFKSSTYHSAVKKMVVIKK